MSQSNRAQQQPQQQQRQDEISSSGTAKRQEEATTNKPNRANKTSGSGGTRNQNAFDRDVGERQHQHHNPDSGNSGSNQAHTQRSYQKQRPTNSETARGDGSGVAGTNINHRQSNDHNESAGETKAQREMPSGPSKNTHRAANSQSGNSTNNNVIRPSTPSKSIGGSRHNGGNGGGGENGTQQVFTTATTASMAAQGSVVRHRQQLLSASSTGGALTCICCLHELTSFAYYACMHYVCLACAVKMRVLCNKIDCPVCRQESRAVLCRKQPLEEDDDDEDSKQGAAAVGSVSSKSVRYFEQLVAKCDSSRSGVSSGGEAVESRTALVIDQQRRAGIRLEGALVAHEYDTLVANRCTLCSTADFADFGQLEQHVRRIHRRFYCDLCVENLKLFAHERKHYARDELAAHNRNGDRGDYSFRGHPRCDYCDSPFFDRDELYRHCRKEHYYCHFCDSDGVEVYYSDYAELRHHFLKSHYLCELDACSHNAAQTHEYVVFRNDLDFQAHKKQKHAKSAREAKSLGRLNIEFKMSGGSSQQQSRNNNRQQHQHQERNQHSDRTSNQVEAASSNADEDGASGNSSNRRQAPQQRGGASSHHIQSKLQTVQATDYAEFQDENAASSRRNHKLERIREQHQRYEEEARAAQAQFELERQQRTATVVAVSATATATGTSGESNNNNTKNSKQSETDGPSVGTASSSAAATASNASARLNQAAAFSASTGWRDLVGQGAKPRDTEIDFPSLRASEVGAAGALDSLASIGAFIESSRFKKPTANNSAWASSTSSKTGSSKIGGKVPNPAPDLSTPKDFPSVPVAVVSAASSSTVIAEPESNRSNKSKGNKRRDEPTNKTTTKTTKKVEKSEKQQRSTTVEASNVVEPPLSNVAVLGAALYAVSPSTSTAPAVNAQKIVNTDFPPLIVAPPPGFTQVNKCDIGSIRTSPPIEKQFDTPIATIRLDSAASQQLIMDGKSQPPPGFEKCTAINAAAKPTEVAPEIRSTMAFIKPQNYDERNGLLSNKLQLLFGHFNQIEFETFKRNSASFRKGQLSAFDYLSDSVRLLPVDAYDTNKSHKKRIDFFELIQEMIVLLPDAARQTELHEALVAQVQQSSNLLSGTVNSNGGSAARSASSLLSAWSEANSGAGDQLLRLTRCADCTQFFLLDEYAFHQSVHHFSKKLALQQAKAQQKEQQQLHVSPAVVKEDFPTLTSSGPKSSSKYVKEAKDKESVEANVTNRSSETDRSKDAEQDQDFPELLSASRSGASSRQAAPTVTTLQSSDDFPTLQATSTTSRVSQKAAAAVTALRVDDFPPLSAVALPFGGSGGEPRYSSMPTPSLFSNPSSHLSLVNKKKHRLQK